MLNRACWSSITVVIFFLSGNLRAEADANLRARVADVLFEQFETVVYTDTDVLSSLDDRASDPSDANRAFNLPVTLRLPFVQLIAGLRTLGPNVMLDVERSYSAIVMGAKNFKAAEGLGMVSSGNSYIAIPKDGTSPNIDSDFGRAAVELIDGRSIWTWSMAPYEGYPKSTKFYAARVAGSFVMANNRQDFQETVRKLTSAGMTIPGASSNVTNWQTLNKYRYWAYRSVRRSPITDSDATGLADLTPMTVTLALFIDVDAKESRLQVHSPDGNGQTPPKGLPAAKFLSFEAAGTGIWQAVISLAKNGAANTALFQVLYYFGFGVAL